jgi:hypothetical protein
MSSDYWVARLKRAMTIENRNVQLKTGARLLPGGALRQLQVLAAVGLSHLACHVPWDCHGLADIRYKNRVPRQKTEKIQWGITSKSAVGVVRQR